MRRALYSLPLAVLLIANVVPSKAQTVEPTAAPAEAAAAEADADADAGEGGKLVYYDLQRNFSFACSLANPTKLPYVWSKNNTAITELPELRERYKLLEGGAVLELPRAGEEDWGNYSCAVGKEAQAWRLHARVYTRLPSANTNVVEGQKLRLTCRVVGRPAPRVLWTYNASEGADGGPVVDVLGADRVSLRDSDAGVQDGELLLEAARRADAGRYTCSPLAPAAALAALAPAHTTLRVKDMYAALWPFLGICAEVLVLCAVILVYEKRRTKPELDDSDTDNHDQKKS